MTVLFDTCVILDHLLCRKGFEEDAERLFEMVAREKIRGIITVKTLMDIHYYIRHKMHDEEISRTIITMFLDIFEIADSLSQDALSALYSKIKDYEDAMMVQTAVSCGADCIVTRNRKAYVKSPVPVYTPKELLKAAE